MLSDQAIAIYSMSRIRKKSAEATVPDRSLAILHSAYSVAYIPKRTPRKHCCNGPLCYSGVVSSVLLLISRQDTSHPAPTVLEGLLGYLNNY